MRGRVGLGEGCVLELLAGNDERHVQGGVLLVFREGILQGFPVWSARRICVLAMIRSFPALSQDVCILTLGSLLMGGTLKVAYEPIPRVNDREGHLERRCKRSREVILVYCHSQADRCKDAEVELKQPRGRRYKSGG